MASKRKSTKSPTIGQLSSFRSKIRTLQTRGLVSSRVDWKTVKPTRHLAAQVKRFEPYLAGQEQLVRLPPSVAREYREAGFNVKSNAVLLPKEEGRRTVYNPETKHLETTEKVGHVKRTYTRLKYGPQDAHKFIADANAGKFDNYEGMWAFYYYGNLSLRSFNSLKELALYLSKYQTLDSAPEEGEEYIPQFSLTQWALEYDFTEDFGHRPGYQERKGRYQKKGRRKRSTVPYYSKMRKNNPVAYQAHLDEDAARKKAARAKLKAKGGQQYENRKAKDAARKRAERHS